LLEQESKNSRRWRQRITGCGFEEGGGVCKQHAEGLEEKSNNETATTTTTTTDVEQNHTATTTTRGHRQQQQLEEKNNNETTTVTRTATVRTKQKKPQGIPCRHLELRYAVLYRNLRRVLGCSM